MYVEHVGTTQYREDGQLRDLPNLMLGDAEPHPEGADRGGGVFVTHELTLLRDGQLLSYSLTYDGGDGVEDWAEDSLEPLGRTAPELRAALLQQAAELQRQAAAVRDFADRLEGVTAVELSLPDEGEDEEV